MKIIHPEGRQAAQNRQIEVTIKQRGDSLRRTLEIRRSRQILSNREMMELKIE